MAHISTAAENEIRAYLVSWWTALNQQLGQATSNTFQVGQDVPLDVLMSSEVGQRLMRIAEASENVLEWSPELAQSVLADCDAFEAWQNQSPITHHTPEEFWNTPVGYMLLKARLWAELDRLTSLKEASELSGMSLSALSQRISRGQLKHYRDPFEPNPQRSRRIRLTDLEQFLHEGLVRKPAIPMLPKFSLPLPALQKNQYHPIPRKDDKFQPQG
jgi:hypothetical protein